MPGIRAIFSAAVFFALAAVPAFAAWQPGLQWGALSDCAAINTTDFPASPAVDLTVSKATTSGWGGNTTYVYWGQIYLDGSTYCFGENIDDAVWLKIGKGKNSTVLLNDSVYNQSTQANLVLNGVDTPWYTGSGWYNFELRFYNRGGGAGPVVGNGFSKTNGFGYMKAAYEDVVTPAWMVPTDPGDVTFLRYDDGADVANALEFFAILPASIKEAAPDSFATRETLTPGAVSIPVPAEIFPMTERVSRYHRVGYTIAAYDEETRDYTTPVSATLSDDGSTLLFTCLDGEHYKIEWLYDFEYFVTCSNADGLGTVSSAEMWVKEGAEATLSATPNNPETYAFLQWEDTAGNVYRESPLTILVTGSVELTAKFWKIGQPFVWYVKTDGDNANDGLSPEAAKASIKAALADIPGDTAATIYVSPGMYAIADTDVMRLKNPILISGLTNPETGEGVVLSKENNSSSYAKWHFLEMSHADAIVENITFRGGYFRGGGYNIPVYQSASVEIQGDGGTLRDCILENAVLRLNDSIAAALIINSPGARVERCIVRNAVIKNTSQYTDFRSAAGVLLMNGVLSDSLIYNCYAENTGNINNDHAVTGGLSVSNTGTSWSLKSGTAKVLNCTILNCSGNRAGGISMSATGKNIAIVNTIVAGCKNFYSSGESNPQMHNFMGNTGVFHACASDDAVAINDSCFAGGTAALFKKYAVTTDADGAVWLDFANSDLRPSLLLAEKGVSQLFDADGNVTETFQFGAFDLAGESRVRGSKIDIGAFEAPEAGLLIIIF